MFRTMLIAIMTNASVFLLCNPAPGQTKGIQAVTEFLNSKKASRYKADTIKNSSLAKLFPKHEFTSVIFPQYPVAFLPPKGLSATNVLVVMPNGKVVAFTKSKELQAFFKKNLSPLDSVKSKIPALMGWLRLTQIFSQDGYFKFTLSKNVSGAASPMGSSLSGKVTVEPKMGNSGFIKATLHFDAKGALTKVVEERKVKAGIRPRCQATLLLHKDERIRAIVRQDLLVMGRAAYGYLMDQRAKASPVLQRAIDEIWQRIVKEDR